MQHSSTSPHHCKTTPLLPDLDFPPTHELGDIIQHLGSGFRAGTEANHARKEKCYLEFCTHYHFQPINPSVATLTYYIAYLTRRFTSARSVHNYLSGARFLHKQQGLDPEALSSFPVSCLLRAVDLTLRAPPNRHLPITPELLYKLCGLCTHIGPLGHCMLVALTFGFFGMLRQSHIAPYSQKLFDPSRHTCRGHVMEAAPGLVVLIKWAKNMQTMDKLPLLPISQLPGHVTDPVHAYRALLKDSPTRHPNQPLLSLDTAAGPKPVTTRLLAETFQAMILAVHLDPTMYSLHSLRRGGTTAAYLAGVDNLHVKRHGNWSSPAFWGYITAPLVAHSQGAAALAASVSADGPP